MGKGNILSYKGYYTKIVYDSEIGMLTGVIEDINDLIYFESNNTDSIMDKFHEAVDDYLEFCKEKNIEPDKAYKGTFNVRIDSELHKKLSQYAFVNEKSLNAVVEESIRYFINYKPYELVEQIKTSINNSLPLFSLDYKMSTQDWKTLLSEQKEGPGSASQTCFIH
ncbi:MAG: type II toxin-antitoxin system HicB family antitoxin [Candidatus Izimaplasma sp.]|nr:type II toxin-antitoxin system HicB family antitoxin [Candidatus Izimaplasma bacterium]